MKEVTIPTLDLIIILSYFAIIIMIGYLAIRKKKINTHTFFLAGRSLPWFVIGAALFSANISTIHLVGLAGSGFKDGLVWGNFEWMASFLLIVLGLVFAPFYFRNKIATLPGYLERRFGPKSRAILAIITILTALFSHIGISLYAGAVIFNQFFGIDIMLCILLVSAVTVTYTVIGGLPAVVLTETVQTVILLIGSAILTILAILELPEVGIHNFADLKAAVKPDQLSMIQSGEGKTLPWYAVLLGYPVLGLYYWCADQTIVQRVLGAKSLKDAQNGPIFGGFLKILPVFLMVLPGVFAYVLFGDTINDADATLPTLITELLPTGLIGILSAALLAALMSTVAAALNSVGTMISIDVFQKLRPDLSDRKLLRIGRITTVVVMILAIIWSPVIGQFESIYDAIADINSRFSPPIATVFLMGVVWKKGNDKVAFRTMIFGLFLGIFSFSLDFEPIMGRKLITESLDMPFLLQSWWIFVITTLFYIGNSYTSTSRDFAQISDLIFHKKRKTGFWQYSGINDPKIYAGLLLITMFILYYIFS